jgi:hypothetical protein
MKAETLNQASDLLHQLLRTAENWYDASQAEQPYSLTYYIPQDREDVRADVVKAMKGVIVHHLADQIERLKGDLARLDVTVTDEDISTHLAKVDARRKEWEEEKEAKRIADEANKGRFNIKPHQIEEALEKYPHLDRDAAIIAYARDKAEAATAVMIAKKAGI